MNFRIIFPHYIKVARKIDIKIIRQSSRQAAFWKLYSLRIRMITYVKNFFYFLDELDKHHEYNELLVPSFKNDFESSNTSFLVTIDLFLLAAHSNLDYSFL